LQGAEKATTPEQKALTAPTAENAQGGGAGDGTSSNDEQAKLDNDTRDFMNKLASFQKDVVFGVGRIWSGKAWGQKKANSEQEKVEFGRLRKLKFGATELLGSL
jgi:hypothetical protein